MKLIRFGKAGQEKPGLVAPDGSIRSLIDVIPDLRDDALSRSSLKKIAAIDPSSLPQVENNVRIGPCVAGTGKFLCIGLNYADHARESGLEPPAEPVVFMKATSAICGPNDDVEIPRGSTKTDWEVELAFVIGKEGIYVEEENGLDHVAGYAVMNDVSEREYQIEGTGQWLKGKSFDTFAPLGPWLVTPDEVPDPQNLRLWLNVNGDSRQDGKTSDMIFGVSNIISTISRYMTQMPGDVIPTGTPPGVGMGQNPKVFLKPGQTMRLGIEGLGEQQQRCVES